MNKKKFEFFNFASKLAFLLFDLLAVVASYFFAYEFSYFMDKPTPLNDMLIIVGVAAAISIIVFVPFGFYSYLWKYINTKIIITLVAGVTLSVILQLVAKLAIGLSFHGIIFSLVWVVQAFLICAYRICYNFLSNNHKDASVHKGKRTLIVGAGSAGVMFLRDVISKDSEINPVVFIDDDPLKQHHNLMGVPIVGRRTDIPDAVDKYKIEQIVLAIPTAPKSDISDITDICMLTGLPVKSVPSFSELMSQKVSVSSVHNLDIHDFLERGEITLDSALVGPCIEGKVVLVTGGGGSIGSELCRQIAQFNPKKLIIFDIYENNAYELQTELVSKYGNLLNLKVIIGSVRDTERLDFVFSNYKPNLVFHAAAHKHVPLMEDSPVEAIKNNVFGTLNVAEAAVKHGAEKFVLISTDKAVNPTNVMGGTKRMAEMIVQYMSNHTTGTQFAAVRFGNVLGSNGSVVPLFKKQIAQGGPVKVTHPQITRYFMTIYEAAKLVLQPVAIANGGEIFILDMGEPVKIDDLARKMITLCGYKPNIDIKIEYIGLRPGEKLFEELLLSEEGITATKLSKIYVAKPMEAPEQFMQSIREMKNDLKSENAENLVKKLENLIGKKLKKIYDKPQAL